MLAPSLLRNLLYSPSSVYSARTEGHDALFVFTSYECTRRRQEQELIRDKKAGVVQHGRDVSSCSIDIKPVVLS
jgi:hypothetical protein